ncbi:MAG TPA: hypothetical protein VKE27_05805 [Candidatus Dormibacteraeota bacterium]|nr:hypothetical protein [Candidatus Dormibacteraeota bacterium]
MIVLLVLLVIGALSSMSRRSMAGGETVSSGGGFGAGLILGIVVIVALIILAFGFFQWNWFGTQSGGQTNNPTITSPAPNNGGASPSASASPSK